MVTRSCKRFISKNKLKPHSFHISISDTGVTGKSHAIKTIFYALTKFLLYDSNNPEKERMLLLGSTGISTVNINGSTNHSVVGIRSHEKYNKLGHKQKVYLRNKLSELKVISIYKISMASNELFYQVHSRLIEIFYCKTDEPLLGIPIIVCGVLYQLPQVKGVPIYLLKDYQLETLANYNLCGSCSD